MTCKSQHCTAKVTTRSWENVQDLVFISIKHGVC